MEGKGHYSEDLRKFHLKMQKKRLKSTRLI